MNQKVADAKAAYHAEHGDKKGRYPNVIDVSWTAQDFWLEIEHDGNVTWDTMQVIKNDFFGENVTCVEVYPAQSELINRGNYRHLWRTPSIADFC